MTTAKELAQKAMDVFKRAEYFLDHNEREGALVSYGRAVGYLQSIRIVQWNYPLEHLTRYKMALEDRIWPGAFTESSVNEELQKQV